MNEQEIFMLISEMAKEENLTAEQFLEAIKAEKESKKQSDAVSKDVEEFKRLFPDVAPADIPDSVWEKVAEGGSLASAYALFVCGKNGEKQKAEQTNSINSMRSAPAGKEADAEQSFTPEQVEDMSEESVKKNFKNIIRSLKNWKI